MSLTRAEYAEAKGLPIDFLEGLGVKEEMTERGPRVVFPYRDPDGVEIAVRYRSFLRSNRYRFTWQKGAKTALYGLDRLAEARSAGFVVLVEGESDCHTLWLHGIPAIGVPGAPGGFKGERDAHLFDGLATIYAIDERDRAAGKLLAKLKASAIRDRLRLVSLNAAKDPSALYLDNREAFSERLEAALQAAVPVIPLYQKENQGQCDAATPMRKIGALQSPNEAAAREIFAEALAAGLSDLDTETLIRPLAKALNVAVKAVRKLLQDMRAAHASPPPTAEERARLEQEHAERRKRNADERERLRRSCSHIALSKTLLADMEAFVHALGVVGEGAAIRGGYLALSSRLVRNRAICLLRRGAPAGGKNYLIEKTLMLVPEDAVIRISSGSPMALAYFGGGDEDALKHRVVYIPEAAVLADKNGVESPLTIMLRELISEGRIDRIVAIPQPNGPPVSERIRRNGPIGAILTSARANIEEELLTRLMTSDADESEEQTAAVLADALAEKERGVADADREKWLDYQRWLEIDAPYEVVLPFRGAILEAFQRYWAKKKGRNERLDLKLRIRRDIHGFLTAVETSAVLHKARRDIDSEGRIVATLDDYANAHAAFDEGLASLYKVKTPETVVAVVKAVEAMGASEGVGVKVTVQALMDRLGISGRGAAAERLKDAEARGFLKLVDLPSGYGRTSARIYEIGKTSKEIEGDIESNPPGSVFPAPADVADALFSLSSAPFRYSGTTGTSSSVQKKCTGYTTVPEEARPTEKRKTRTQFAPDTDGLL
jgi:hypothetical protein